MPKFKFRIVEEYSKVLDVEIEAEDVEEAWEIANQNYETAMYKKELANIPVMLTNYEVMDNE